MHFSQANYVALISIQVSIIYMKNGQQRTTQGATTESRKRKGNMTTQKNDESKKSIVATSKVMYNEVGITAWVSIGT